MENLSIQMCFNILCNSGYIFIYIYVHTLGKASRFRFHQISTTYDLFGGGGHTGIYICFVTVSVFHYNFVLLLDI
jgi:hypothetical protein